MFMVRSISASGGVALRERLRHRKRCAPKGGYEVVARISIQLYSLREEAKQGFGHVLERLGRMGYAGVEPAGLHDLSPTAFKRCLTDAGMVVSSAHVALAKPAQVAELLDAQQEIGAKDLVVAFLPPERFVDKAGVSKSADHLNTFNEAVRARAMTLGYHNHWWEFSNHIGNETAHALLFRLLDPTVFAEIDTYWAKVGGADPAKVVRDFGARARLLHIKDGPADDPEAPMTAVGKGVVDVAAIVAASRATWHVVELDRCATDMYEAVQQSYTYLTQQGLAQGRV
jgi:sugar phosphate isomerase/epimerase